MRVTAYKRVIDCICLGMSEAVVADNRDVIYLKLDHNPRQCAIHAVKETAKLDKLLFHSELAEVLIYEGVKANAKDKQVPIYEDGESWDQSEKSSRVAKEC